MSDLNQITEDTKNEPQVQEILIIHDKSDQQSSEEMVEDTIDQKLSTSENDSEYEDLDDDDEEFDEIIDTSILTSLSKILAKANLNDDELHINIKPRCLNKKPQDDEHSEGCEEEEDNDDNQSVPDTKIKTPDNTKKSDKTKGPTDDDNDSRNPAYIPRKGKFYEHDDRTLDEYDQTKQEVSKNEQRFSKDSDAKWPHDLYDQDEQESKSQRSFPRQGHGHFGYQQHSNPNENYTKPHNDRINTFNSEGYDRPHGGYNRNTNNFREAQEPVRQQRYDSNPHRVDEHTFHRRRNFTNTQFQQHRHVPKSNNYDRNDQRQLSESNQIKDENEYNNTHRGQNRNVNNIPPRRQVNNNNRDQTQNINPTLSSETQNIERPKRYSNMRNNFIQQQAPRSQLQSYKDQRSNNFEQNDWPQAPPPPTSCLPQQLLTPQMFYQQQTSRYVPMNYSQLSNSQQNDTKQSIRSCGGEVLVKKEYN